MSKRPTKLLKKLASPQVTSKLIKRMLKKLRKLKQR